MRKLGFETTILIITAILVIVLIGTLSYLINFLVANINDVFNQEISSPTSIQFDIKKFEGLKLKDKIINL